MLATPLRPGAFFGALFAARLILSVLEMVLLLGSSRLLFHIRVQGSYGALAFLWLSGSAAFFGLAVLIGSRTDRFQRGPGAHQRRHPAGLSWFVGSFSGWIISRPICREYSGPFLRPSWWTALRNVISAGGGWSDVAAPRRALLAMGGASYLLGRRLFRFY